MARRVLLLASGTGSLAEAILTALDTGQLPFDTLEIVGLISDKNSPALEVARKHGVPEFHLPMQKERADWDRAIFECARRIAPDLVVSVGFMRILSPEFVSAFPTINTHPSLLPLFPGAHAVRDALAAKVQMTGTSVHWVDFGLDTGQIIAQRSVKVNPDDDESTLHERIKIVERALIVETLSTYGQTGIL